MMNMLQYYRSRNKKAKIKLNKYLFLPVGDVRIVMREFKRMYGRKEDYLTESGKNEGIFDPIQSILK